MAKFRKIDPRIWNDEKFRTLGPDAKLLAMYCLTAQVNRVGIFRFSVALAAEDLGLSTRQVDSLLDTLCHTLSWQRDKAHRILYLPHWWRYNNPGSQKTMVGILSDLHELPRTPLLQEFFANRDSLSDTLCHTLSTFEAKGMAYQEQEQEQEQEQDTSSSEPPSDSEQVVLEFPTVGSGQKTWALTQSKADEYAASYPGMDVLAECRAARQWCIDNTAKRKTPRGMPKFLNGWLERSQNSGRASGGESTSGPVQVTSLEKYAMPGRE